jgi:hypothetical protein
MDIKRRRITGGILAVLTATVVSCGSVNAGSAGHLVDTRGGGDSYLTANDTYGQGLRGANNGGGPSVAPADALDGPQFQP